MGFIPWHTDKIKLHDRTLSPEMIRLLNEDEKKKTEIYHTLTTILLCIVFFALLAAVKNY